ncbi:hypothetical protein B0H17DRAFT_1035474 [Mycena rosella]|uniref:Ribosome biogenesis protein SLX9 n=1 Tax=Mycena rosella TaxID=1033263 RepID=A0AAD7GVE3_MYCRO|nr:hypothetical protein B0H17DRAFT_1035474 [Mycena rosella]
MDEELPGATLKKKEKQQLKREALLQRLESTHSPYSKSHARRQKRKAKEQVGGGLDEIQLALAAVEDDDDGVDAPQESTKKPKPKPGQIGEGKGAPLSKAQRQRALYVLFRAGGAVQKEPDVPQTDGETQASSYTGQCRVFFQSLPDDSDPCTKYPPPTLKAVSLGSPPPCW